MSNPIRYTLRNDLDSMQRCLGMLEKDSRYLALPEKVRGRIALILDELISNVIKYAGPGRTIRLEIEGARLSLRDDGPAFNPWDAPEPQDDGPLEEIAIGGRGIHMVKSLCRDYGYDYHDGWNCLTLHLSD